MNSEALFDLLEPENAFYAMGLFEVTSIGTRLGLRVLRIVSLRGPSIGCKGTMDRAEFIDRKGALPKGEVIRDESVDEIAFERRRQIEEEGYSSENDDEVNGSGELALAAACYASPRPVYEKCSVDFDNGMSSTICKDLWPWSGSVDHRGVHSRRLQLTIAGALIAAEMDRLKRIETAEAEATIVHVAGPEVIVNGEKIQRCKVCGERFKDLWRTGSLVRQCEAEFTSVGWTNQEDIGKALTDSQTSCMDAS